MNLQLSVGLVLCFKGVWVCHPENLKNHSCVLVSYICYNFSWVLGYTGIFKTFHVLRCILWVSHTHMHTHTNTNTHKHTHKHTNTHKHIHNTHTHTHKHTHTHNTHTCKHKHTHIRPHIQKVVRGWYSETFLEHFVHFVVFHQLFAIVFLKMGSGVSSRKIR